MDSLLALHERLAQKAWAAWDRNDPNRPTVAALVAVGEREDRRKIAAWEAKRAVWAAAQNKLKEKR